MNQQSLLQAFSDNLIEKKLKELEEIEELLKEDEELTKGIQNEERVLKENLIEIDEIQKEFDFITRENIIIKAEKLKNTDVDSVIRRLEEDLKNCTEKLKDSEEKYSEIEKTMENAKKSMISNLERLQTDLENSKATLAETLKVNEELLIKNQSLKDTQGNLKSEDLDSIKKSIFNEKSEKALFLSKKDQVLKELLNFVSQVLSDDSQIKQDLSILFANHEDLLTKLSSSSLSLENSYSTLLSTENKLLLFINTQTTLEQECCIQSDLKQFIEDFSALQQVYKSTRAEILKTLDSGCDFMLKESEKVLDECKKVDGMIDFIDEKEYEIENMRTVLSDIKNRTPTYVPIDNDPVDIALAEFLNSCDQPVSIPFTRENEGIYTFGTKKVFLKLENGKVKIRVGGGFTQIEEFIEIYAPIELERQEEAIESNCPQFSVSLSRFHNAQNKGMSPLRAARIIQTAVEAISSGSPAKAIVRHKQKK